MTSLLFQCPVCRTDLRGPVTLSCGYTVCEGCLPAPSSFPPLGGRGSASPYQRTFKCPVQDCQVRAHVFDQDRRIHVDSTIDAMLATRPATPSSCGGKLRLTATGQYGLLRCPKCVDIFCAPTTASCGHVYCKVCLLELAIRGESCIQCCNPLPGFNHLQQIAVNRVLAELLFTEQGKRLSLASIVNNNGSSRIDHHQQPMPVFVTDVVILPGQHVGLPVYGPAHIRMLRAVFGDRQCGKLCLATVHRGRPLARYGTVVEIVSIKPATLQHGRGAGMMLHVVGRERMKTAPDKTVPRQRNDSSALVAFVERIPADKTRRGDTHASDIRRFLITTKRRPPPAFLWGPLWFVKAERTYGPLPPVTSPVEDLLWWAAIVLPITDTERYRLLCRVSLHARLSLVHSWTRQLRSHWSRHRPQ